MGQINCETVRVNVRAESGEVSTVVIPAFTVPPAELITRIDALLEEYIEKSQLETAQTSLGDFVLYLLTQAKDDPRTMERIPA